MFKLSVCLLTCNSARLLRDVLPPLLKIADDFVVLDSGSTDATLDICREYDLHVHYHPYAMHGAQMNHATSLAAHDWVLCMDSDEILDEQTVNFILQLKAGDEPVLTRHGVCRVTGMCWVNKPARYILYLHLISLCAYIIAARRVLTIVQLMIRWKVIRHRQKYRGMCATIRFIRCMKYSVNLIATPRGW
jgi:glycosyltransferase involved in cell wall biosynthesis